MKSKGVRQIWGKNGIILLNFIEFTSNKKQQLLFHLKLMVI